MIRGPMAPKSGPVLIVGPVPPPYGGMALQARALVERLRGDGVAAELLPTNPPVPAPVGRVKGARTLVQSILFLARLTRALCRFRIVHLLAASRWYFVLRVAPTVLLGTLFRRRIIINYRGGEAPDFFARFTWLVLPILRRADAIVVPSVYLQRVFEKYGFRAAIIANFVDLERFRYRQRDRLKPKLLVTRSLEPLYNVKMALEACAIIQRKYPDAAIDVVGGGSEEAALREWVQRRGLTGVCFHGAVPNEEIPRFLANADIFLNPTNADNMPLNLLEAFAAGVPVVTTNVGGIPDLLGSVEAAMLVDPNDAAAMAAKIEELLCRPESAARLTRQARSLCEQTSWSRVGRLWRDVYEAGASERAAKDVSTINQNIV